jgi:cysteine-rich repeat protein
MFMRFTKLVAATAAFALMAASPATAGVPLTTTTLFSTTTTSLPPVTGACCFGLGQCDDVDMDLCQIEMQGSYSGDGTSCETPDICGSATTTTLFTTTTTIFLTTTTVDVTTTTVDVTTTTLQAMGACCVGSGCSETSSIGCLENQGSWNEGLTCEDPGVCVNCGNGCLEWGEACDDGGIAPGDGCDSTCQPEGCYECTLIGCLTGSGDALASAICAVAPTVVSPFCAPSPVCTFVPGPGCTNCGDGVLEDGEDCDDGNTDNGDCCSSKCSFEAPGATCSNGQFCDGAESCDGKGACQPAEAPADCSNLNSACATGTCDPNAGECVAQPVADGTECTAGGDCIVDGTGTCQDGTCVGTGTTLSPTCRWIILGATDESDGTVKVRTGEFSKVDANTCGDIGRSGGITSGSFVVSSSTGEGIRFDASADVQGDIVTGGSSLGTNLYADIPGTGLSTIAGGSPAVPKVPAGTFADTSGSHELVQVCLDDQQAILDSRAALDLKPATGNKGYFRARISSSETIDVTGTGLAVIDFANFRLGRRSTLTLKGNPGDVLMLRVIAGRMNISTGAKVVLDGLQPENVLFYVKAPACRIGHSVAGAGTVFCANAGKFRIGVGTKWTGSFLGGTREIRARFRADLTHAPFTGF